MDSSFFYCLGEIVIFYPQMVSVKSDLLGGGEGDTGRAGAGGKVIQLCHDGVVTLNNFWLVPRGTGNFISWESQCFPKIKICYIAKKTKANFEKRAEIPRTTRPPSAARSDDMQQRSNISRVTVNCFPFDVIVFAMLPAHGIWRETVSLLDVMWPWTSQWMDAL